MADTVVSPLLWVLSDRLDRLADITGDRIWRKMRLTLAEIRALVLDAERVSERDEGLKCWLTEISDVAYQADDLFDKFELLMLKNKESMLKKKVGFFFTKSSVFVLHIKLAHELRDIEGRLDELLQKKNMVSFKAAEKGLDSIVSPHTQSFIIESDVVGRLYDKEAILELLLESDDERQFSVLPIVGMGGIGKTTLAKLVYNDERVRDHFEIRAWVCVSQDFDVRAVAKGFLEATTMRPQDLMSMEALGTKVRETLDGRRFFIVLDDVWTENGEEWSILVNLFSVGARGSKVLLTTRSKIVATLTGTVPPYILYPLSAEDSWFLFRRLAFGPTQYEENARLEEIGRRIVTKCRGVPLAVRALGGLLHFKRSETEWLYIMKEDIWKLPDSQVQILPVLRLSYDLLPPHLKQCFAYCSLFPNDYIINKEKLILLWIAAGFVRSTEGSKTLEDIGNDYFMELCQRSFFIDVARDDYSDVVEFKMHDLIHDLALSVAGNWCLVVETGVDQNVSKELRQSSLVSKSGESTIPESLHQAKKLRTLLLLSGKFENIPSIFVMFRCLRVLDLSQSGLQKLPITIGNLIHLRYLDLSHTYIETLPKTISKLKSLQTLELSECYNLLELPKAISDLINLRHLGIHSCPLLSHMPFGIGKLRLLQTLPTFILGKTRGCGSLSDLSRLNLKGRLEIKNLEHVSNLAEAHDAKLYDKLNLHSLGLSWGHSFDRRLVAEVLESLRPRQCLRVLDIIGYEGPMFPSWLQDGTLSLVKISLINCSCQALPPLGQLPYLRDLYIKGLSEVQFIGHEFYGDRGFLSLKQLDLYDMPNLLEWRNFKLEEKTNLIRPEESSSYKSKEGFPCLETLSIRGCSKLTDLPALPNLRELALSNCNMMLLGSLAQLTSLSSLVIDEFRDPMVLSTNLGSLHSIRTLTVYNCDDLISLLEEGMQGFTSLQHLSIQCCDKLQSVPMGLRYLTSLQKLDIVECHDLVNIPDILQFLPSLEKFIIEGCPNLDSLPDSMQSLNSIGKVVIKRCPKLERKLEMEKGGECFKIAYIPYIEEELGEFILEEDTWRESQTWS